MLELADPGPGDVRRVGHATATEFCMLQKIPKPYSVYVSIGRSTLREVQMEVSMRAIDFIDEIRPAKPFSRVV